MLEGGEAANQLTSRDGARDPPAKLPIDPHSRIFKFTIAMEFSAHPILWVLGIGLGIGAIAKFVMPREDHGGYADPILLGLAIAFGGMWLLIVVRAFDPLNPLVQHPSDADLVRRFQKNEETFNKLFEMSNADPSVIRIAYDFTRLEDNWAWPRPMSQLGFSEQRWDEYRRLFRKTRLKDGISRGPYQGATVIFLTASSKGLLEGSSKGYAYASRELSPLLASLDQRPYSRQTRPDHGVAFKKIKGNWYLSYDW